MSGREINQLGTANGADVGQGSDDSKILLNQNGFANNSTIDQWNGHDSGVTVNQNGVQNGALVNQTASGSQVYVTQTGYGNHASASQY
ncbi:Major curlin subunit precursor CsgA [Cronobacter universalis NCTC 9529]|nr:Major curlin subunit precursor CsgA [Cronobacter universalis NCTC 9529]